MEIEITELMNEDKAHEYSGSVNELGENAGKITWNNALNSEITLLKTEDEIQNTKKFLKCFGAWTNEEIESWDDKEVNALLIQLIAGDIREENDDRLFENNGKYYYYVGE